MMNFKEIEKLIENFSNQQIAKLNIKQGDFEILLEKSSTVTLAPVATPVVTPTPVAPLAQEQSAPAPTPSSVTEGVFIQSPMVGTFYHAPAPDSAPYVKVGDKVKKGQVIGIVEAMKIMNEIEAEFDCKIVEVVANDAQPVEYGSKLIKVEKL